MMKSGKTNTRIGVLYMDILTENRYLVLEVQGLFADALAFAEYSKQLKANKKPPASSLP